MRTRRNTDRIAGGKGYHRRGLEFAVAERNGDSYEGNNADATDRGDLPLGVIHEVRPCGKEPEPYLFLLRELQGNYLFL